MKKIKWLIFIFIRGLVLLFLEKRFYKLDKLEFIENEWVLYYFFPGDRVRYSMAIVQLKENKGKLDLFSPYDASLIGFCLAEPTINDFQQVIEYFK